MNKFGKLENKGFTLIELIVAISIIVILTSLFLANYRGGTKQRSISSAVNNLVSDLHKIQSYSLSSRDYAPGTPASQYAVVFVQNNFQYSLWGYNNAIVPTGTSLSTVNFPPNVAINSIQVTKTDGTVLSPANLQVNFKIPFGKLIFNFPGSVTNEINDTAKIQIGISTAGQVNSACAYVLINGITGNITTQTTCP